MSKFPFLKMVLLNFLAQRGEITGYDFLKYSKERGIPASPGTVYPQLYDLLENGVLSRRTEGRKKFYRLTEEGKKIMVDVERNREIFRGTMRRLGIMTHGKNFSAPEEIRASLKRFFFKMHSSDWNKKEDVAEMIEILEELGNSMKRWNDEK